jgi:hypothetical protein
MKFATPQAYPWRWAEPTDRGTAKAGVIHVMKTAEFTGNPPYLILSY